MRIDRNSRGTIALVYLVSLAVVALLVLLGAPRVVIVLTSIFLIAFCIWQTLFFRVPARFKAGSGSKVSAVADGRIVIIGKVFEPEYLKKECIQISTYMNFWDVHANFWPVDGVVTYYKYHPGKHLLAFKPKASEENEHTCIGIQTPDGQEIFFKQLAGTFARRIVCYAKPGLKVKAGRQCGIIKFGSRIDLYVPLDAHIRVQVGEEPVACETIMAELR